jgi:short-subunit dehydrogenase
MRCLITGHTSGIGRSIYNRFKEMGFDVIGISKSTGIDIEENYQKIINDALGCDLFVNNAYHKDFQIKFLNDLSNKIPFIISLGLNICKSVEPST